jgi:hypothetical protein
MSNLYLSSAYQKEKRAGGGHSYEPVRLSKNTRCNDVLVEGLVIEGVVNKTPFFVRTEGKPRLKAISSV